MTTKKSLPEITVSKEMSDSYVSIVDECEEINEVHSRIGSLQAKEKTARKNTADMAEAIRKEEFDNRKIIGMIRVVSDDSPPIRVEFRNNGKCLDSSQGPALDALFGPQRPLLFQKDFVVTEILDPEQVIEDLKAAGKNPWDFVKLEIKKGQDRIIAENTNSVQSDEGFVASEGFLATLDEMGETLSQEARDYIQSYLDEVLSPKVVMTRGKK